MWGRPRESLFTHFWATLNFGGVVLAGSGIVRETVVCTPDSRGFRRCRGFHLLFLVVCIVFIVFVFPSFSGKPPGYKP